MTAQKMRDMGMMGDRRNGKELWSEEGIEMFDSAGVTCCVGWGSSSCTSCCLLLQVACWGQGPWSSSVEGRKER